ncbi:MAG: hypothetical protein KIY12_05500 [Thermoplasmata archaeon]|uniref:Uncharacterized protein n=1 Tax=Candidatus Sysuiplasma superficiale TaxID=2823368 RepID=A0A8J7YNT9_9ARCH|nr:hypothetical protein [Candidatus Sysuiplasma superficiale]MBX8644163.1 hypothetical protein [Candidatus Sysuiplasma superficiale]
MSSAAGKEGKRKVSAGAVAAIVVLAVIAGVGWGLYATKAPPAKTTTALNSTVQSEIVTSLAFEHWNAIGIENINLTMSQYSSNATLYWYVNYSSYDNAYNSALNGTHAGLTAIRSVWTTFFSESVVYYWVGALKTNVTGGTATVTAHLWYLMSNGTVNQSANVSSQLFTVIMPYELYYFYSGGHWYLSSEWWGFPNNQGHVYPGAYGLQAFLKKYHTV